MGLAFAVIALIAYISVYTDYPHTTGLAWNKQGITFFADFVLHFFAEFYFIMCAYLS